MRRVLGQRWGWFQRVIATGVLVVASAAVALLGVGVVGSITGERAAVSSLATARKITVARVDSLDTQIDKLGRQSAKADVQRERLLVKLEALSRQLEELGVRPVVSSGGTRVSARRHVQAEPSSAAHPQATRSAAPHPTPTGKTPPPVSTPTPSPTPSPTPTACAHPLLVVGCL